MSSLNQAMIFFNIFGGLAIFLYAMKLLSNSLQNVIGEQIEYILKRMTNKPYKGIVVGALVTFLTQSSSITVLTLIGLVNVGVLSLRQGVGIILGAEIGTTITAQLVAFNAGLLYFPLIVVGFSLFTFVNRKTLNSLGKILFSFGLLFMGMELMKTGAHPLRELPLMLSFFERFGKNPLLGIIIGAFFTGITSSSSATTSLAVALGASKAITLPAGFALILGANIGTCLLELIAVMGMSLTAKRIAVAQVVINLLGVAVIFPFITPFANLISLSASDVSRQIANSHTIFNLGSSFVFLFLTGLIVYLVKRLVPGQPVKLKRGIKYIDSKLLSMPHIALVNATKETKRAGQILLSMLEQVRKVLLEGRNDLVEIIYNNENQIDFLNERISRYLTLISEHELDDRSSARVTQLLHGVSDIERASDHLNKVAEQIKEKRKKRIVFSSQSRTELASFLNECAFLFKKSLGVLLLIKPQQAAEVFNKLQRLRVKQKKMKAKTKRWSPEKQEIYFQILHNLERVANHANNIAQIAVSGF